MLIPLSLNILINVTRGKAELFQLKDMISTFFGYKKYFNGKIKHFRQRVWNRNDSIHDVTIAEIFSRQNDNNSIMLKMDIEGAEYRVIQDVMVFHNKIPVMAIEFHDTGPLRETFVRNINLILEQYDLVHLHGNNYVGIAPDGLPDVLEITFLHKKYNTDDVNEYREKLPLRGLDVPNNPNKPDYILEFS